MFILASVVVDTACIKSVDPTTFSLELPGSEVPIPTFPAEVSRIPSHELVCSIRGRVALFTFIIPPVPPVELGVNTKVAEPAAEALRHKVGLALEIITSLENVLTPPIVWLPQVIT
jgi:hypothetical protein